VDTTIHITTLDTAVIGLYLVALLAVGLWAGFGRGRSADQFLGGRSLRWPSIGLSIFATNIGPFFLIASCGAAYRTGMVTANYEWLAWWFLLILGVLFVPYYLGTGISTMPQFLRVRFGAPAREFLSWYALFATFVLWVGTMLFAGGKLFSQLAGWPLWLSLLLLGGVAVIVTIAGGLRAVVITDAFQAVLMIGGAAALSIIAVNAAGGPAALVERLPDGYLELFRPADDPDYPWPAILLGYPVLGVWFWCTDQTIVQRVLGARDLRQAQLGTVFAGFLKILPPFIFLVPGMACFVLHPGLDDPDHAFALMVANYLPAGMTGLIIGVLIAALITTLDSGLNSFSTIFTLDIYTRWLRPQAGAAELNRVGRICTVAVGLLALFLALLLDRVETNLFDLAQSIIAYLSPPMAAVFLLGVLWPRTTGTAAITTLAGGSLLCVGIGVWDLADGPGTDALPHFMMMAFLLFAVLTVLTVAVSLLTRHRPDEQALPSLCETLSRQHAPRRLVPALWALLAVVMLGLYLYFN
jgi:SSS family solute:Na+ symporter